MTQDTIKSMQLYPRPERILADLAARGYAGEAALDMEVLTQLDQLHYHGTEALDAAISQCGIGQADRILEVGSGWAAARATSPIAPEPMSPRSSCRPITTASPSS